MKTPGSDCPEPKPSWMVPSGAYRRPALHDGLGVDHDGAAGRQRRDRRCAAGGEGDGVVGARSAGRREPERHQQIGGAGRRIDLARRDVEVIGNKKTADPGDAAIAVGRYARVGQSNC